MEGAPTPVPVRCHLRALRGGKEVLGLQSRKADFLSNFEAEEGVDTFGWEASQSTLPASRRLRLGAWPPAPCTQATAAR